MQGKEYNSITEAARIHNLKPNVLNNRIHRHGKDSKNLFIPVRSGRNITILGVKYSSISDAARAHNLKPNVLNNRIHRYGINDKKLFAPAGSTYDITILGVKYSSISDAAKKHNIDPNVLNGRIKHYGTNWPHLFDTKLNQVKQAKEKLAHQNCISVYDFAKQLGYANATNIRSQVNQLMAGTSSRIKIGLRRNDIVEFSNSFYHYGVKLSALNRIQATQNFIRKSNLKIVPQTSAKYYYDEVNNELYSCTPGYTIFKLKTVPHRNLSWRVSMDTSYHETRITKETICDLIKNPQIKAKDLYSITQIKESYPELSKIVFSTWQRPHTRWNIKGYAVKGYTKKEVKKLLKEIQN